MGWPNAVRFPAGVEGFSSPSCPNRPEAHTAFCRMDTSKEAGQWSWQLAPSSTGMEISGCSSPRPLHAFIFFFFCLWARAKLTFNKPVACRKVDWYKSIQEMRCHYERAVSVHRCDKRVPWVPSVYLISSQRLRLEFALISSSWLTVSDALDNSVARHVIDSPSHPINGPLTHALYITSFALRGPERTSPLLLIREA
jgi:hypothetical protein